MRTSHLSRRGERGAVLIIVSVFCLVAVLMLAFVIDLGAMREQKRDVTLSTDAAALAAANSANLKGFLTGSYKCKDIPSNKVGVTVEDVARDYLQKNDRTVPASFPCDVEVAGPNSAYVVVGATETVEYAFGELVGQSSAPVSGASIAAVNSSVGGGVRPIGLCARELSLNNKPSSSVPYSMTDDVLNGAKGADGMLTTSVSMVLEIEHLKNSATCDSASGQRGQVDFDGKGGNGGSCEKVPDDDKGMTFAQEIGFGFFDPVKQQVNSDSGDDWNKGTKTCFNKFIDAGTRFWLPVWTQYNKPPSKTYTISSFVEVELEGYCLNNDEYPATSFDCKWKTSTVDNKGKVVVEESDWIWVTARRVFTPSTWPALPPATSDAGSLTAALCAEVDTAAARASCKK